MARRWLPENNGWALRVALDFKSVVEFQHQLAFRGRLRTHAALSTPPNPRAITDQIEKCAGQGDR